MNELNHLYKLTQFRRGETKYGLAPHKPVLALTILDIMDEGILDNNIPLDERLRNHFSNNWNLLVNTGHSKDITKPIFHLQKDMFWGVYNTRGKLPKARAISTLKREDYKGVINEVLFQLLQVSENRDLARMIILDTYFPTTKDIYFADKKTLPTYINEIEKQVIESPIAEYRTKWTKNTGFVRDWKFSIKVKEAYDYTCCISGYKIEYEKAVEYPLIEAAHIEPHSETGNNHISNGIPLLVNIHRAFDSGLIGVDNKYHVIINHKNFKENKGVFSLETLEGRTLILPDNEKYYPSLETFQKHRLHWGVK